MNLTNKLLFPLLLIATLFTSACFDDTPAPKSVKEPCVAASECESNQCVQGLCAPTPKKLNDPCVTNSECKSPLVCLVDKCANKPADGSVADSGACTEDIECQAPGSTCKNDVCTAPAAHSVADKGACSDTVQCQYGSTCDTATNTCLAPADGSVAIGAMCAEDKQCKSNKCDTTTSHTCQKPLDLHKPCSNPTPSCGAPLVCLAGLCEYAPGDHTVGDGGDCTDIKQCALGLTCDSGKCKKAPVTSTNKKLNDPCVTTSECKSPLVCLDGKCANKPGDDSVDDDSACTENKECHQYSVCKSKTPGSSPVCVAMPRSLGERCMTGNQCASNTCDNSICVPKDNSVDIGDPCTKTSQCKTDTATPVVFCVKFQGAGICSPQCDPSTGCGSGPLKCLSVKTVENNSQNACYPNIVKKGQSCVPTDLCEQGTLCLSSSKVCGKPGNNSVNKGEECTGDSKECVGGLKCSTSSYTCE